MVIISKHEISNIIFDKNNRETRSIINLVVETSKKSGVGSDEGKQLIKYDEEELKVLRKISEFMLWIYKNESSGFRTKSESKSLIENLLQSLLYKKKILIFALFCPSYKKNPDLIGFNRKIGETNKRGIENLSTFLNKATSYGFNCYSEAIFSDLALENNNKLTTSDFLDLEENFNDLVLYTKNVNPSIQTLKLSEIGKCKNRIGYGGTEHGKIPLDENEIKGTVWRSISLYKGILGWTDDEIINRTDVLARSCAVMGEEIKKTNKNCIMVMTESIYERGRLYNSTSKIPIFYPRKYDKMKVIVFGGPISGKSTAAAKIANILKVPHISTGRIIDAYYKKNNIMLRHTNKPSFNDDTLIKFIEIKIKESEKEGFVLEGYPKYDKEFLHFEKKWNKIDLLIVIKFDKKLSLERSRSRLICSNCNRTFNTVTNIPKIAKICDFCNEPLSIREDDNISIVKRRLNEYQTLEKKILSFLKKKAKNVIYLNPDFNLSEINMDLISDSYNNGI